MHMTTLATLSLAELAAAYTTVYQDYLVPFVVDEAWAKQYLPANDIVPAASPLWLDDDGNVIALAALGRRGLRGWVGGFGVAPEHRGQGLASRLIAALLDSARAQGLTELQLEVITGNTRAIRTYERTGFVRTRDLRIFAHPAATAPTGPVAQLHPATSGDLLPHGASLRTIRAVWQREPVRFAQDAGLSGLALGSATQPEAYALYRATPTNAVLLDFVAPTIVAAEALAAALPYHFPGHTLRLTNEPEESPVCAALDRLGWEETLRQHEMVCRL